MVTIVTRAGKGSELTHNEVDANFTNLSDAIDTFGGVGRYTTTIGNGSATTFTVTHNLGTKDIAIVLRANNPVSGATYYPFRDVGGIFQSSNGASLVIQVNRDFTSDTDNAIYLQCDGIFDEDTSTITGALPTNSITVTVIGGGAAAVDIAAYDAVVAEVETARAGASSLDERVTTISDLASPNGGAFVVGNYYDNAYNGTASGTLAGAANRVVMAPFFASRTLRIDQLGIAVSTAVASSTLKCFVYSSGADGWPDALIYEGSSDLSGATTGYKSHTVDITFAAGEKYWLGVKMNSTATYRTISVSSAASLGISGNNATSYFTVVTRTLTYANALPSTWSFVSTDLAASSPPSIRMRAAALP